MSALWRPKARDCDTFRPSLRYIISYRSSWSSWKEERKGGAKQETSVATTIILRFSTFYFTAPHLTPATYSLKEIDVLVFHPLLLLFILDLKHTLTFICPGFTAMKQFKFDCDVEPSSPFTTLCRHVKSQFKSTCGSFILISFPINMEELESMA